MSITGFDIIDIDITKLKDHTNVILDMKSIDNHAYFLRDGHSFSRLRVDDNEKFGTLMAGIQKRKDGIYDYAKLTITIGNEETGNLYCLSMDEYKKRIQSIFLYLCEEYGILVDESFIKVSNMEINCTFAIKEPFYKYHRVLRLIMYNLPDYYKKETEVKKKNKHKKSFEAETFYRGNSQMEIIIYDKGRQLQDTRSYYCNTNIMRIEFVLKHSKKVKEVFGDNSLEYISDGMVKDYFIKQFRKLFERRYQSWRKYNVDWLNKRIIFHKEKNRTCWQKDLLTECRNIELNTQVPVLLDIQDLLKQIKLLEINGHYSRVKQEIYNKLKPDDTFLQNDSEKIEEIISKVEDIYNNDIEQTGFKCYMDTNSGEQYLENNGATSRESCHFEGIEDTKSLRNNKGRK